MDETPMKFDMPGNRTLQPGGTKTVLIRTNGAEKRGFTAILTIAVVVVDSDFQGSSRP